ncbi:MAG: enoyl-CoA hydratase/isomerase family protein [Alphaproteobacteria bacterium]|nr:enoyl-CoA hydratase/isomerase family protein [Alphaproteobacteria bacterium]HRI76119.1 enoyl-CoA hydratase/isomerase family protein [Alphaproteobacteria bacterium]
MTQEPEILFEVRGGVGLVTLNRPAALNALTLGMIRALDARLAAFAKEPTIKAVIITGAGERAFCSGGDVKAVALESKAMQEGTADGALTRDFFREEYVLNHRIFTFPKPYISLVNGIVMGGGKGVSAHGSHRVVTESTLFAMPETNIGFFPDVGGGYFLPRCPGQTGAYLALTSKRIKAIDTVYIGFGTHYVAPDAMTALREELCTMKWDDTETAKAQVDAVIEKHTSEPAGTSEIAPHREQIDTCFAHDRVEDIIAALQADGSEWANETLQAMYAMSPTSLKIALRQIRMGANMPFAQVMTMEYRLSQALMKGHDFYEGIRAALIDKDRQPKWQPPRINEVSDQDIDACFQSLGERDLVL